MYIHVKDFTFDHCVQNDRGQPLFNYDVVLVSMEISKRLQASHFMSIGFTEKYGGCLQVHHYNSGVLSLLKKWGIEEKSI